LINTEVQMVLENKHRLLALYTVLKQLHAQRQSHLNRYNWAQQARPAQRLPQGDWRVWLILAGRGFGKTRTGAETVRLWALQQQYKRIALIAATEKDARQVMIEGESGLLNVHPPHERPRYEPSRRTLFWQNGAIATCYSADHYSQLRGPQFDAAWIDELAKFHYPQEVWDQLNMSLRLGKHPRIVITTTPRPVPLLKKLLDPSQSGIVVTRGTTYENAANLSPEFIQFIKETYENSPFGQQEIFGELVEGNHQALWDYTLLQKVRCADIPPLSRVVVAIDPAVTHHDKSDETGLIVAGKDQQNRAWILEDLSGRFSCEEWAQRAIAAYHHHRADLIVAEVNKGGDLVHEMLRAIDPTIPFRALHATRSKITRAEPVAALYRQQRVFHASHANLTQLEKQLCTYSPEASTASPDRLDALVWAITELLLSPGKSMPDYRCWSLTG
jgi:predicted phage terminase large subunit-like protein